MVIAGCQTNDVAPEDVMKLVVKNLGLNDKFHVVSEYVSRIPYETRLAVWIYWHQVSEESTMSTQLARLLIRAKKTYSLQQQS